jgi:ATP-binding cassette, subfamily B (MDR/TAP), member 1
LDGYDIYSLNLHWLRQQISFVGQDPTLFNTTIFENIKYGLSDFQNNSGQEKLHNLVIEAAVKAKAHDFISALPQGYQTEVGERGAKLSGGQRQRIALARALIRNPSLLLLDEATSALDSKTEEAIQRELETTSKSRTTVIIAHRLTTVRNADNIIVMSNGGVVEQGRHDELMARNGIYANMVGRQQLEMERNSRQSHLSSKTGSKGMILSRNGESEQQVTEEKNEPEWKEGESVNSQVSLLSVANMIGQLTRPERYIALTGIICSAIVGLCTPVYVNE